MHDPARDIVGVPPFTEIDNVGEWIAAGACAVGIGSDLLDKKAIEEERYEVLTDRAKRMVQNFLTAKRK